MRATADKTWYIPDPVPTEISEALKEYPYFLRQVLYNRGICDLQAAEDYLSAKTDSNDPNLLKDMDLTIQRLSTAIDQGEYIAVYGDYDVDGVTATALMVQVLQKLGARVREYIPNRFDEGYGVNNEAIASLAADGVKLIITVDCGIRSPNEVEYAKTLGVDMIITDHHFPREKTPDAVAVICHKQLGDLYPDKNLAGVGLAYKVAQALIAARGDSGLVVEDWLDLVAVGTVADVVPLTGENRKLVKIGLALLRMGRRPGLLSLANVAGLDISRLNATDIGFGIGPRLNAAGRLDSALKAFSLLMAEDVETAAILSQELDDQNRERQQITQQIQLEAENFIESEPEENRQFLLFSVGEFNPGVVGLAAAKLSEMYYRPAIVGHSESGFIRASCRSIPEFHITRALDECADLLVKHGGHAMAAGFTVAEENLDELIAKLRSIAARELGEKDLKPVLRADVVLPLSNLKPTYFKDLDRLQPTGEGNPEVVFVSRKLKVLYRKTVGKDNTHLKLTVTDGTITYNGIAFRQGHWAKALPEFIDIMYTFEINRYNGNEYLQLNIKDIKLSSI